jgi:hypothetical protein
MSISPDRSEHNWRRNNIFLESRSVMKLTQPLRAIGGAVIPESQDNPIIVPGTLQPVVMLPGVYGTLFGVPQQPMTTTQEGSFCSNDGQIQAPSQAAVLRTIAIFAAGVWRVQYVFTAYHDFTAIGANQGGVSLLNPQGQVTGLISSVPVVNSSFLLSGEWLFNFSQPGFSIRFNVNPTAAAQNIQSSIHLVCGRMA